MRSPAAQRHSNQFRKVRTILAKRCFILPIRPSYPHHIVQRAQLRRDELMRQASLINDADRDAVLDSQIVR